MATRSELLKLVTVLANADRDNDTRVLRIIPKDILRYIARIMHLFDCLQSFRQFKPQTLTLQLFVIGLHGPENAVQFINNPSENVLKYMMCKITDGWSKNGAYEHFPLELQWKYVMEESWRIRFVKNPPEEMQFFAINDNFGNIINIHPHCLTASVRSTFVAKLRYAVKYYGEEMWKILKRNGYTFSPVEWVIIMQIDITNDWKCFEQIPATAKGYLENHAVRINWRAIQWCQNPRPLTQILAVEQDWHAIEMIQDPCEEAQMIAVIQDLSAIDLIKNPTENVLRSIGASVKKRKK